jgi:hypothetical protein
MKRKEVESIGFWEGHNFTKVTQSNALLSSKSTSPLNMMPEILVYNFASITPALNLDGGVTSSRK